MSIIVDAAVLCGPAQGPLPPTSTREKRGTDHLRLARNLEAHQERTVSAPVTTRRTMPGGPPSADELALALDAVLDGDRNSRALRPLLERHGIDLDAPVSIIAARSDGPFRTTLGGACHEQRAHGCASALLGGHRVTLVQDPEGPNDHAASLFAELEAGCPRLTRVGIGAAPGGAIDLRTGLLEAEAAMHRGFGINAREPLTLDQLLCALPTDSLREHAESLLAPLARHDQERQTELLKTLLALVTEDFSTVRVAKRLFVHQNTVKYRVTQIGGLTGLDLNRLDGRAQLWMAVTLLEPEISSRAA